MGSELFFVWHGLCWQSNKAYGTLCRKKCFKIPKLKYLQLERKPIGLKHSYQNTEKQIYVTVAHVPLY